MAKKYELTSESKTLPNGATVYRIRRLSDNELGGWLEAERNLSQSGDAFVTGDAWVYGNARVYGDALVTGNAFVTGDADIIFIQVSPYPITITRQNIVIGCLCLPWTTWRKVNKRTLKGFCREHQADFPADRLDLYRKLVNAAWQSMNPEAKGTGQ